MIKSKNTNTISVRVSNRMREGIENLATDNEATQSEVIRYAVQTLLSNEE
jgi:Arc/MetJ-type ribon-helix-helix transcriptional regulator